MRALTPSMFAVAGLTLLGILAPGAVASAAVRPAAPNLTCSGYGCDGRDPINYGCASTAITAESANIYMGSTKIGEAQLRYSTACRTVWGRVLSYDTSSAAAFVQRNTDKRAYTCNNVTYSQTLGAYSCYTPMLYDGGPTSDAGGSINLNGHIYAATTVSY